MTINGKIIIASDSCVCGNYVRDTEDPHFFILSEDGVFYRWYGNTKHRWDIWKTPVPNAKKIGGYAVVQD